MLALLEELARCSKSPDCLRLLSQHTNYNISLEALDNNNCSVELLRESSTHKDYMIRWSVVLHDNVPRYLLDVLLNDEDINVRETAKRAIAAIAERDSGVVDVPEETI
jgi:hypothetical protein